MLTVTAIPHLDFIRDGLRHAAADPVKFLLHIHKQLMQHTFGVFDFFAK